MSGGESDDDKYTHDNDNVPFLHNHDHQFDSLRQQIGLVWDQTEAIQEMLYEHSKHLATSQPFADRKAEIEHEALILCHDEFTRSTVRKMEEHRHQIEASVLSILDPTIGCERGPSYRTACAVVENFWAYMRDIGKSPEFLLQKKEIVGVAVTDGMSYGHRRHFDLVACACAQQIADSYISEFEVLDDMVTVYIGPFFGRLFEMASRDPVQGPDLSAIYESIHILKRLMWVPNCRNLFAAFTNQLCILVKKVPAHVQQEILTSCVNLVPVFPQLVRGLFDAYTSKLDQCRATDAGDLEDILSWVDKWHMLPLTASNDVVEFLRQGNITTRIISSVLGLWKRFSMHQVSIDWIESLVGRVLSTLNMLCHVDPHGGHKLVLQFVEDNIERSNLILQSVSVLVLIPVIVTGGTIEENLLMKAFTVAGGDGAPPILEVMFSLKQAFHMLSSTKSIELLFEKALERHRKGSDGLLFQMLKFCAARIKGLPRFPNVVLDFISSQNNQNQEAETRVPRKRPLGERISWGLKELQINSRDLNSAFRHNIRLEVTVTTTYLDTGCVNTWITLLAASLYFTGAPSHFLSLLEKGCYQSQEMIAENQDSVASFLSHVHGIHAGNTPEVPKCIK
ncbi:hypothetical protein Pelo_16471 [Pelomyxa schiedti]|nr:hypothetical protein Pelo_16471 [Pelomyxa schiedti]